MVSKKYRNILIICSFLFSIIFININCATTSQQQVQQPVRNPILLQPQNPPQYSQPVIPQIDYSDAVYLNITPISKAKDCIIYFNNLPVGKYSGPLQQFKIDKNSQYQQFPIEITVAVPENDDKYKVTQHILTSYNPNEIINIKLKRKLTESTKKTVTLFVDMFNSAYEYYTTNDVTVFSKIQPGSFYYITEAFEEVPVLEADEVMKIVDMINKNLKLPENDITAVIRSGVDLLKNVYIKKNAKQKLTAAEELKLKEEITNSFTQLWWRVFDIIKSNKQ